MFYEDMIVGGYIEVYCRDITQLGNLAHRLQCLERKVRLYHEHAASLPRARYTFNDIVSQCPAMDDLKARARKYSQTDLPVLIFGETGPGKELMAHSLHAASPRSRGAFITVNCAAIPENLLESELFGYEEGTSLEPPGRAVRQVRTGRRRDHLSGRDRHAVPGIAGQAPAGHREQGDPEAGQIAARALGFPAHRGHQHGLVGRRGQGLLPPGPSLPAVPPLSCTSPAAGAHRGHPPAGAPPAFGHGNFRAYGRMQVHPEVMAALERYPWPGNVRELRNLISAAAIALDERSEDTILIRHLPANALNTAPLPQAARPPMRTPRSLSLKEVRSASERELILEAVRQAGGNKSRAASLLGISRNELYRKLRKHAPV
jgi:hypothetical protein